MIHCQEVREMKEKMEVELHHRLDSRELLLNQKETDLTALQVLVVQYILSFVPLNFILPGFNIIPHSATTRILSFNITHFRN
jgi:hypothetical protein